MDHALPSHQSNGDAQSASWLVSTGLLWLGLGGLGLFMVLAVPAVGMSCYGVLLTLLGVIQFGGLRPGLSRSDLILRLLLALAYIASGLVLVFEPTTVGVVQLVVAFLFAMAGLLRIGESSALAVRSKPWGILAGAGSILLGVLMLVGPGSVDWLLGAAAALDLAFFGGGAMLQGRTLRQLCAPLGGLTGA